MGARDRQLRYSVFKRVRVVVAQLRVGTNMLSMYAVGSRARNPSLVASAFKLKSSCKTLCNEHILIRTAHIRLFRLYYAKKSGTEQTSSTESKLCNLMINEDCSTADDHSGEGQRCAPGPQRAVRSTSFMIPITVSSC